MGRSLFRFALIAASLPLLGGCVAALVPVVASGTLIGKQQLDDKEEDGEIAAEEIAAVEPEQMPEPAPVAAATPAAPEPPADPVETAAGELPPAEGEAPSSEMAAQDAPTEDASSEDAPTVATAFADIPASTPTIEPPTSQAPVATAEPTAPEVTRPSPPPGPTDLRAYDALYSYVESQARRDPVESSRQSAILASPGSLSPQRTDCSIRPPAVLFDLDYGDQPFDTSKTPRANPALAGILAAMRLQEIEIFWISEQSAIAAGSIRKALVASGLDTQGRDGLLLMRRSDDRKQSRRRELSETHCLLAIGGDRRADFDELYLYLKDENTAQPLEELIGAGWFITPLPLTEGP
ncbi:hypothetical protein [Pontixanthobacter aquaemixtae]|uniref:Uncharacterized protein n=1 Tax=Pontixanthobacter aquaemixtae TaxID=1958940 RepID=A0A844ZW35_9SPHN|nr:hypothetical protein [Pontixanthobacter aquaemixtae]MXO91166.1 hypothetical protein [Pontixanthobacter aquaemixtae]